MRAMYVAPLYLGERVAGLNCLPPDPVWVDWQARLLVRLAGCGRPIAFKAHPENCLPPSDRLLQLVDAQLISQSLEGCDAQASVFVMDFLSSPFKTIVHSSRPIVVVDHGLGVMTTAVRALLERRCAVVPGGFSADNRLSMDWQRFADVLDMAEARRDDRTCANALFGYSA